MSSRIFKNYQINLGMPFQVKVPFDIFENYGDEGDADAGAADAGAVDAGAGYSGAADAGAVDAGVDDAGAVAYAGAADSGAAYAGTANAGAVVADAGAADLGAAAYAYAEAGNGAGFGAGFGSGFGAGSFIRRHSFDEDLSDEEAVTAENIFAAGALGLVEEAGAMADDGGALAATAADAAAEGEAEAEAGETLDAASVAAQARQDALAMLHEAQVEAERIITETEARCAKMEAEARERATAAAEEAERAAASRKAQAEEECAALRKEAAERGQREGYAEGQARGQAEYGALIASAEDTLEEARKEYRALLDGAEEDAVELVLGIARKVIGEEMAADKRNLLHIVRDAFRHCSNKELAVLKVAPGDYEYVQANRDALLSMAEGVGKLEIKRDQSLSPGACLVETPFGSIDASVATRIGKIEDAFYRVLAKPA